MKLLSQIDVSQPSGTCMIQLLQGDLTAIPPEHETDLLVMSAFPGDYIALEGSLIHAFYKKGLSMEEVSRNKAVDLRNQLHCWLSKPLAERDQRRFNIKQVLCFEPGEKIKQPEEVVGDIFRCINTFAFEDDNNVVVMPIIATGYQRMPLQKIFPVLLQTAQFWLQNGLPLDCLKLVVHSNEKAQQAMVLFNEFKSTLQFTSAEKSLHSSINIPLPPSVTSIENPATNRPDDVQGAPPSKKGYDYFLSYAHAHSKEVQFFVDALKSKTETVSIFYDRDSIPPGGLWIQQISAAIQQADKVLVFLSPEYDKSPVCWDEFQCAKLLEYNRRKSIIQTVYLYGYKETEMPLIMGIYSYIDCREGDIKKLETCVQQLLKQ